MNEREIEFVGGPRDGQRMTVPEDMPCIEVFTPHASVFGPLEDGHNVSPVQIETTCYRPILVFGGQISRNDEGWERWGEA